MGHVDRMVKFQDMPSYGQKQAEMVKYVQKYPEMAYYVYIFYPSFSIWAFLPKYGHFYPFLGMSAHNWTFL